MTDVEDGKHHKVSKQVVLFEDKNKRIGTQAIREKAQSIFSEN